jgi:hypothetical protein
MLSKWGSWISMIIALGTMLFLYGSVETAPAAYRHLLASISARKASSQVRPPKACMFNRNVFLLPNESLFRRFSIDPANLRQR